MWSFCLSLVLQVAPQPVGQGKVGKKVESVPADAVPDALTTQLAQQSRCSFGNETMKNPLFKNHLLMLRLLPKTH